MTWMVLVWQRIQRLIKIFMCHFALLKCNLRVKNRAHIYHTLAKCVYRMNNVRIRWGVGENHHLMSTPGPSEVITLQFMHFAFNCFAWLSLHPSLPCAFYMCDIFRSLKGLNSSFYCVFLPFYRLRTTVVKVVIDNFCCCLCCAFFIVFDLVDPVYTIFFEKHFHSCQ